MKLLSVHAHPDDESSKGAGTVAKYKAAGVETVLVCCTGGEAGDILNPAMDREEVRANLPEVRRQELDAAAKIIGYDTIEMLGFRDSGMPDTPENAHPDSFAQASEEEAVGRLVAVLRKHRPDVVITYGDEQETYPHPDHLRVHDITIAAWKVVNDPSAYPEAGEPFMPTKLYYSWMSHDRTMKLLHLMEEAEVDLPNIEAWKAAPNNDFRITTRINVAEYCHVRSDALRAHASQIDPESPFWFLSSPDLDLELNGEDDYVLAESLVETVTPEIDLFAGIK